MQKHSETHPIGQDDPHALPIAQAEITGPPSVQAAPKEPKSLHDQPSDLISQLWFEQFRQLAWFSATAAGGSLLLSEGAYVADSERLGMALVLFVLAAVTAFIGQDKLVDHLTSGRGIQTSVRLARLA